MPAQSDIGNIISAVHRAGLWPFLKARQFRRRDNNYHRTVDDALQVVTVQSSQWNGDCSGRFRVNFGVHFASVARRLGLPQMPRVPKEHYCALRGMWSVPERWWNVDLDTNVAEISEDLAVYTRDVVWTWLRTNESLTEAALTFERQPNGVGLWLAAGARLQLGQQDEAERLIRKCIAAGETSLSTAHPANVDTIDAQLRQLRQWAATNNLAL